MKISLATTPRAGVLRNLLVVGFALATLADGCNCAKKGTGITGNDGVPTTLASLNFGNVAVGQHSSLALILKNTGSGELDVLSQQIQSDASNSFSEPTEFLTTLAPGQPSTAIVEFSPTQSGPLTAALNLTDDGSPSGKNVLLTGTGIDIDIVVSPPMVNFGPVQVGVMPPPQQTVTFTNNGAAAAILTVDTSPLGDAGVFTLTDSAGPVQASNVQALAPNGGTYALQVAFEPNMVGNFSSAFNFTPCANLTTCLSPQSISVNGVGISGQLVITPDPVAFGVVPQGAQKSQTVTVQNVGSNTANVTCVYLKSAGNGGSCNAGGSVFAFGTYSAGTPSAAAPISLATGASFTFVTTYTATGNAGGDSDTLEVDYLAGSGTNTSSDPLSGNQAVNPCTLTITPAAISFGTVTVGNVITKFTTLGNTGGADCMVTGIALGPNTDPSYAMHPGQMTSLDIVAGATATISVDFNLNNSSTPNQRRGTIAFASNDPNYAMGSIPLVAYLNAVNPYATGWPKWHYDNNNSGQTSADTSNNTGHVAWQFSGLQSAVALNNQGGNARCGGEAYLNSPVVADGPDGGYFVYQVSLDGYLYAFDQDGTQVFKTAISKPTSDPHPSTPAVAKNGNIWTISGSDLGGRNSSTTALYYLNPNGNIAYSQAYGEDGFDACPGLGPDGTLYEADDDGEVGSTSAADPYSALTFYANGNTVTKGPGIPLPLTTESERFGVAIGNDSTSYWGNNGQFFAVTPPDGGFQLVSAWPPNGVTTTSNANDSNCTGPVYSDLAVDPLNTNLVYAYSAWEDGSNCSGAFFGSGCQATSAGGSGCTAPYTVQGLLVALSIFDGSPQWTLNLPPTQLPSGWNQLCSDYGNGAPAVAVDGTVYVGNSDGLRSVVGVDGGVNWTFNSANVTSSPAIGGDGTIFYGAGDGSFYAVNPDGSLRFKVQATGVISSSPAIADDGTVFFVSDDGVLWAVR